MKLVALFAALLAVSQIRADSPGFAVDEEYKYEYRARAATGITEHVNQFSGFGFRGNIVIQNQGTYLYLKFQDLQYGQFNRRFTDRDVYDEIPIEYEPVGEPYTFLKEALSKPFRVTMEKGLVKSFDVYPQDPEWSVNVKRSILSLLQLNLDGVNRIRPSYGNVKPTDHDDFYRVMEDGIGGECETIYDISHHAYHHHYNERVVNVTKNRRYDHCTHRPYSLYTTHMGYKCDECEGINVDPLTTVSNTDYQLRGDRHFYTIERIYNTGKFHFTPFTTNAETIVSVVNQTLFLTSHTPISNHIPFVDKFVTYTSLSYNGTDETHYDPTHIDLDVPNTPGFQFKRPTPFDYKPQIRNLLNVLGATFTLEEDITKKHLPEAFVELVNIFSQMTFNELKETYLAFVNYDYLTSTNEKQREKVAFFEALISSGTNPAVKFLFYALEQKYIRPEPAATVYDRIAYFVKDPSETLAEYYHTKMEIVDKTAQKSLYQVLWLGFGTLVHRGCDQVSGFHDSGFHHSHHHVANIRPDTCHRYAKEIQDRLIKATDFYDEILYIKILGNMGLKENFDYLRQIITGEAHYDEVVRLQAFWASMKFIKGMREELLSVFVPIFNNYTEPHAIRIAAFEVIMYSEPQFTGLKTIADRLRFEPDRQVASFVYSTFVAIANSSNPCFLRIKRDCKRVLSTMEPIFYGYQYSRMLVFDYYNDKYAFGGQSLITYSGSNESLIPESFYFAQSGQVLGYSFDYFSIDFESRGFAKFFEKFIGPNGIFDPSDDKKSLLNIFRRRPRDVNTVQKELDEIRTALPVTPREHQPAEGLIDFSSFDQDSRFFYFHQKDFANLKDNNYIYVKDELIKQLHDGYKINRQQYLMIADVSYEIPTEIGFPLRFGIRAPAVSRVSGEVKFDVEPGFFPEDRQNKKARNIRMTTDLKPLLHVEAFTSVTLKTPILTDYGYVSNHELMVKFPLKLKLDYDVKEKTFHARYSPSQTQYKFLHYSNQPSTFLRPQLTNPTGTILTNSIPIHFFERPSAYIWEVGTSHFGAGLKVNRTSERTWTNFGSYLKTFTSFFTKRQRNFESSPYPYNVVHRVVDGLMSFRDFVTFYPSMKPYYFKAYFVPSTTNPTTEYELTIDFVHFFKTSQGVYVPDVKTEKTIVLDPTYRRVYGIHFDLAANGAVPRNYHVDFNISYPSIIDMPKKWSLDYRRSPIPNYDTEPFKVCYRGSLTTPPYKSFSEFDSQVPQTAVVDHSIHFGKECEADNKIEAKVTFEHSDEQKDHIANPTHCPKHVECEEMKKKGSLLNVPCFEFYTTYNSLRKYTIDVDYKNLPASFVNYFSYFTQWAKRYFYTNLWDYRPDTTNPEGHIKIVANYSLDEPARMDLKVKRPGLTAIYKDLFYPYYKPMYDHFNIRRAPVNRFLDRIFHYSWEPTCMMVKDEIWTYDHFDYQAPLTDCYHVYSKDCSRENLYTLLVKKTVDKTHAKAIKLFVEKYNIEVLPIDGTLTLRINGVGRQLPNDNLYVIPDPEHADHPLIKIFHVHDTYIIQADHTGITVVFNGKAIVQTISNTYRGHVCGLCGDANGEAEHELSCPSGCVYDEEHPFTYSWAVPDGKCTIPKYDAKDCYYPFIERVEDKCTLKSHNKVITRDGSPRKPRKVCFSTNPVPECGTGCKVTTYLKKRVGFHCLNEGEDYTTYLIRESKNRELNELKNKSEDYYEDVQLPENCVRV